MKKYNVDIIMEYKELIENEPYLFIIEEMKKDLKEELLNNNTQDSNYFIINEFSRHIEPEVLIENLLKYFSIQEGLIADISKAISGMKSGFINKHDKIVARDKKWLSQHKKGILALDFSEIELEVLSDYKVTFEQLVNRHNIFDKIFVNSENNEDLPNKLRRFEDKNEDLKNGLDNYFRTGTSRREIGLRKLSGDEAKVAVENMIAYCESFINGKKFLEEKMNNVLVSVNDSKVEESYTVLDVLKEAGDNIDKLLKEPADVDFKGEKRKEKNKQETKEENSNKSDENVDDAMKEPADVDFVEGGKNNKEADDSTEKEIHKEENNENEESVSEDKPQRGVRDRQIGIAVLLTVAEERYFDYINILKGLVE